jgi:hypothetical protein
MLEKRKMLRESGSGVELKQNIAVKEISYMKEPHESQNCNPYGVHDVELL